MIVDNIPLPLVLDENRRIHPVRVSINLAITPLSDASMVLPQGESLSARAYVELFTCMGSAGVFRVRSPQDAYGMVTTTAELEHAIVEVGDYLVKAKYDEMMSASTAMQTIFSHYHGTRWQLGSVSALGTGQVALQANYDRVLEAMLAILEQKPDCMMSFDFSTTPWTVNIVAKGTVVTAEGRLSRNVNYARVTYDDTELCTRVYYEKPKANQSSTKDVETEWLYINADSATVSRYGLIEREVKTGGNFTREEADRVAQIYLNEHKAPRVSVEIGAEELSSITGESIDSFTVGKLFRLVLIDYDMLPIEKNITGLNFNDVYGSPQNITVMLDQEEDTLVTFIHDMDSKGGSGGGGGSRKRQDDEQKLTWTEWVNEKNKIGMVVGKYQGDYKIKAGEISLSINDSGQPGGYESTAYINADHVNISATDTAYTLAGDLEHDAQGRLVIKNAGGMYVARTQQGTTAYFGIWDDGNITSGMIVSKINGETSATIKADYIDIQGLLSAFESEAITCGNLACDALDVDQDIQAGGSIMGLLGSFGSGGVIISDGGLLDCYDIDCADISADAIECSSLKVGAGNASWQSKQIVTGVSMSTAHYYLYTSSSTSRDPTGVSNGKVVYTVSTATINYLGGADS